jgi:hypothetical protein
LDDRKIAQWYEYEYGYSMPRSKVSAYFFNGEGNLQKFTNLVPWCVFYANRVNTKNKTKENEGKKNKFKCGQGVQKENNFALSRAPSRLHHLSFFLHSW